MGRTWKAFLYTDTIDPWTRIGSGPWYNIDEAKIADNVQGLKDQKSTSVFLALLKDEKGNNLALEEHDILIGNGTNNCKNWTSDKSTDTCGTTGHSSSDEIDVDAKKNGWILTSAHDSPCNITTIVGNLGRGKFYCFASD